MYSIKKIFFVNIDKRKDPLWIEEADDIAFLLNKI
jgi:hypothetical protein